MIIDYDDGSTIEHGHGYPTGLEHEEKMDVIVVGRAGRSWRFGRWPYRYQHTRRKCLI